jgi:hypothetical protein
VHLLPVRLERALPPKHEELISDTVMNRLTVPPGLFVVVSYCRDRFKAHVLSFERPVP